MMNYRKIYVTVWLLCLSLIGFAQFDTWIVDNNIQSPTGSHIFADLPDAISAAAAGDVIYVKASPTAYTNATVDKELSIIGEGFYGQAATIGTLTINLDASFSEVRGMKITDQILFTASGAVASDLSDIVISNNFISKIVWNVISTNDSIRNTSIVSNIIGSGLSGGNGTLFFSDHTAGFLSITNNVFFASSTGASINAENGAFIANNLFVGTGTEVAFDLITNCFVDSNIFYGRSAEALDGTSSGNSFSSNYAFSTSNDDFSNSIGVIGFEGASPNSNINPQLLNITLSNTWDFDVFTMEYDYPPLSDPPPIGPPEGSFSETGEWLPTIESMSGVVEVPEGVDLVLDVTAFIDEELHDVPSLTQFEYFFDDDPGFGLGIVPSETPEIETYLGTVSFAANSLSAGFHNLYLRATDENRWGLYKSYTIYVVDNAIQGFDIDALEYFFDSDPGAGLANDIPVSRANSISDFLATTDASSLTNGFHNFFLRAGDQHGQWGLPQSNLVFVDNSSPAVVSLVQEVEYFFDEDPGYGLATKLTVSTPANTLDFVDVISTITPLALTTGFHNLFIRAQDDGGTWGLPLSKLVYVDESGAGSATPVQAMEYFFDEDPGYGSATAVDLTDGVIVDELAMADASTLSLGFHNLFIRVQDTGGRWSIPISKLLYVDESGSGSATPVQEMEYFFDDDPGYGLATAVDLTDGVTVDELAIADASTLSLGFHNLFIRIQDTGGRWSIPISKLLYVDESGSGSATPVQVMEYFFDDDPGYGLATAVDLTDGVTVNELAMIDASTLSLGFHNLFIRVQDVSGRWSIPISRLIYVDPAGNVASDISEMEYFFDTDPGYGQGISILVDPAEPDPIQSLILDASALSAGEHVLGVRAKSESDVWGITSHESFISFPPSRELDSVSLIVFYNETDGDNWANNSGWISGSLDTWYGVTLNNNRVDSIKLGSNNLEGMLPQSLGYVDEVTYMSLAENILRDTIPSSFVDLNNLVTLRLHANQFNEIPNMSSISTLENVALDSNYFDFGDLEPFASVTNLSYENQKIFNDFPVDSTVSIGQSVIIDKFIEGINNSYQWYLDNNLIEFGDLEDYTISNFNSSDTGTYVLRVNNSLLTDIELETQPFRLGISDIHEDSLALVSLYNSTGGTAWTGVSGWLSSDLASWTGVTVDNQRVVSLDLPSKNLNGKLPSDFSYADSLVNIDLSGNTIQDTVPETFQLLSYLKELNIASNRITSIPEFNNLTDLNTLNVSQNILQFGDLEKNIGVPDFQYASQDSIGFAADTIVDVNANLLIEREISGPNNTYQWLFNGTPVTGNATSDTDALLVETIDFADEGNYVLEINNTQITDLTLHTKAFNLGVSSLERDANALLALYDATDGDNWSTAVNWKTADIETTAWTGVTLGGENSDRVTEIDLSEFGLKDTIPTDIRDITSLQVADLADNEIAALPNMSGMTNLTNLNLEGNKLVFKYLIPNKDITGVSFANQKRFGETLYDTLDAGGDATLDDFTNIDFGSGTILQWNFGELVPGQLFNNDVDPITGANQSSYVIEDVNINSQGTYRLSTTHPDIPGITIESRNQNILAKTDFFGSVSLNGTPVSNTEVVVWRKTSSGPFAKEDSTMVDGSGNYILEDVVLGTFIVLARPDRTLPQFANTIQTYYISADAYTEADELLLEGETEGIDINLIDYTPDPSGNAIISGVVESEFDEDIIEEEGGRITARRKVKKAGCSMRRFKAQGRPDQDDEVEEEIAYYIETDDEGFFNFAEVAEGKYLLNIEFPGVPVDENAEVVFEIGGDRENQIFDVNVLITESGIDVTQEEILYNMKPYLKDVNIYPNPTEGELSMEYMVYRKLDDLKMQLVSAEGVILLDQEVDHRRGLHLAEIDLTYYESGLYYLIFTDEAGTFAHPIKIGRK